MEKTKQVWRRDGVSVRQKGDHFYVGRNIPQRPDEWKPPLMVFGPLPSRLCAIDFTKDYFFGVRAARRRNILRAQVIIKKFKLEQFDWDRLHGNYLCVLTTVARLNERN